jgi:class 3 adenylate cyclase
MPTLPLHVALAVFDIMMFGARSNSDQQWLRDQMYALLKSATERTGIPWERCDVVDRGDGVALLIHASVSKQTVADGFVREVLSGLRAHNRYCTGPAAMHLRMALHAGEVSYDGKNWVGSELNTACRLVDVPELREALLATPTALLALCVSDLWFQTVVRHDPGLVDHLSYTPIAVVVKELDTKAWLHVPRLR